MEKLVGKIRHYYPKIGVAVVDVSDDINVGDEIFNFWLREVPFL